MEKDKLKDIEDKYNSFREEWSSKIKEHSSKLRDVSYLTDLQINIFSDRQFLLEYLSKNVNYYNKQNKVFRERKFETLEEYTNEKNLRYNAQEKNIVIEGKHSSFFYKMELIESQINFTKETLRTVDSIIFAIKNRLEIKQYEV